MEVNEAINKVISKLEAGIKSDEEYGSTDPLSADWRYEEGVLLCRHDARLIVQALKDYTGQLTPENVGGK